VEGNKTTFIDVICNHAMVEIADLRLENDMNISPARFFRKMALYMIQAIPRFNRPPEAREWLKFTAPVYDDYDYTVPGDYVSGNLTIETGMKGYDVVSAIKIQPNGTGVYDFIPLSGMTYDAETGNVTIPEGSVSADDNIAIDFYTDGYFDRELGFDMKDILGLLIQYVWECRFANDFLLQQPKIKDRSFDVGNEANHMRASTERMKYLSERNNQRLKAFEQNVAYRNTVLEGSTSTGYTYAPENT
jgi:hypothetical protein